MEQGAELQIGKVLMADGIRSEFDVSIPMSDGTVLRADVFRPAVEGRFPVLITYGPYGKGLHFADGYPSAWEGLIAAFPEVLEGSSGKYQSWEVPDPEKWIPWGYALVRVDSRGAGASPGYLDYFSPQEAMDFAECVEWAGGQEWSNGAVGVNGISYYAIMAWRVAQLAPPSLKAICVWEGAGDQYRDVSKHGGIHSSFLGNWYKMQVAKLQHGYGERGFRSRVTGEYVCGSLTLSDEELAANRIDIGATLLGEKFDSAYFKNRSVDWSRIEVPVLSAGNWGGQGLHLRGNIEGFVNAASKDKWLEVHGLEHWTHFMSNYGLDLQRRFFDHFLKGDSESWAHQPRILLQIRHVDGTFVPRAEAEWPLARTQWARFGIDLASRSLVPGADGAPVESTLSYKTMGEGVTFFTEPASEEMEITGPLAARLHISSETSDADIFLVVRAFTPDGQEITFPGAVDPHTPIAQGWLRASHRELDEERSLPYRPYHRHQRRQPLTSGEVVQLDIEIQPTCLVLPKGYRLGLTVLGRDYECDAPGGLQSNFNNVLKGCGPFLHDDPADRPPEIFDTTVTIHGGGTYDNWLLLPVIPGQGEAA